MILNHPSAYGEVLRMSDLLIAFPSDEGHSVRMSRQRDGIPNQLSLTIKFNNAAGKRHQMTVGGGLYPSGLNIR